jgi:hypothetical protein
LNLESLRLVVLAASYVNGVCLLALQLWAYGRYKHFSFGALAISSAIAIVGLLLLAASGFASLDQSTRAMAYTVGNVLFLVYMPLGLWGTFSLFRAYGALKN